MTAVKAHGINERIILKTLSYSEVFDRPTNKTKIQALIEDDNMVAPLKPAWLGDNYAQIQSLVGYIVRIGNAPRLGGLGITFTDGSSYYIGTLSRESRSVELKGSVITCIETWGSGAIDEALFTLSDGRTFSFGERYSYNYWRFEAPGHYIAGLYLASDEPSLCGQAAGIMASYHLRNDPTTDPSLQ